jgi:hypothetical protein
LENPSLTVFFVSRLQSNPAFRTDPSRTILFEEPKRLCSLSANGGALIDGGITPIAEFAFSGSQIGAVFRMAILVPSSFSSAKTWPLSDSATPSS